MTNPELRPPGAAAQPEAARPPVTELGVVGWLRKNLFSTWYNSLLTLVTLWLIYSLGGGLAKWALFTAKWQVIDQNLRVLMVGAYPPEQLWRIGTVVALASALAGITWGAWAQFNRQMAIFLGGGLLMFQLLPISLSSRIWVAAAFLLLPGGAWLGARLLAKRMGWLFAIWTAFFGLAMLLIGGGAGLASVELSKWNGLLLTVILAAAGMVACFPIGILLALGRRSSLPAIRWVSIAYIEIIRGVPLISVLFMASLVIPLFLPPSIRVEDLMRAFIGLTLFEAAYMAENIRGGLQAIPKGQEEAAAALGLKGWQTILFITLPQALRAVIPAMVGQFIALLKDTSLISIIGLAEFVFIAKAVLRQPDNVHLHFEIYLFVAFVFWALCYALSVLSRYLEKRLGVGER